MNAIGNYLDPLGYAIGSGIGQGLQNFAAGRAMQSDMTGFLNYLNQMQQNQQAVPVAQAATNWLADTGGFLGMPEMATPPLTMTAAPVAPPQMRTPQGQQMLLDYRMAQMDPYRQAQIGGLEAQAMRDRAAALATLNPPASPTAGRPFRVKEDNEYGLPAGSVVQFDANNDMKIIWQPQTTKAADIVRQTFQAQDGTWHVGLFSAQGELQKDLGPAPPSMVGQQAQPSVDAERAARIRELRSMAPLTPDQQTELNALLIPGASAVGPTRDDQAFYVQRGFTPEEADSILSVRYGLKPRAGAAGSADGDLNRWLSIFTKSSFDPIWGQDIPELSGVKSLAQRRIDELTAQLRNGPGAKPMPRDQQVREILNLKVGDKRVVERVPTAKLFSQYPVLTSQLPTLSPEELDGVLSAIESGMTETEILRFFSGVGTPTPAGVQ